MMDAELAATVNEIVRRGKVKCAQCGHEFGRVGNTIYRKRRHYCLGCNSILCAGCMGKSVCMCRRCKAGTIIDEGRAR